MITALNGRLPTGMLVVADTGANGPQQLRTDAAASWARMLAAGMPAGCLRSGYRTLAQQSAQDPALALPAGTSQHGEGLAADVDELARSWIAAHGLPYGWRIGFVPGEPWHAQYDQPDRYAGATPTPTPAAVPQEVTMKVIKGADTPECWVTDGITRRYIADLQQLGDILALAGQGGPQTIGQWTVDRIPVYVPPTVDPATIATAVVAALPQSASALTADQVSEAVRVGLSGLTLKAVQ